VAEKQVPFREITNFGPRLRSFEAYASFRERGGN
jgi:hypothetical protein